MPLVQLKSLGQIVEDGWLYDSRRTCYYSPQTYPFLIHISATPYLGKEMPVEFIETAKGACFRIVTAGKKEINPPMYYFPVSIICNELDTIIKEIREEINN